MDSFQQWQAFCTVVKYRQSARTESKQNIRHQKLIVFVLWSSASAIHSSLMKPGKSLTSDVYINKSGDMMSELKIKLPRLVKRNTNSLARQCSTTCCTKNATHVTET